jgi:hypothetical protein
MNRSRSWLMAVFVFALGACGDDASPEDAGAPRRDGGVRDAGTDSAAPTDGAVRDTGSGADAADLPSSYEPCEDECAVAGDTCRPHVGMGSICTRECTGDADCPARGAHMGACVPVPGGSVCHPRCLSAPDCPDMLECEFVDAPPVFSGEVCGDFI